MNLREIIKLHKAMGKDLIQDGVCYYINKADKVAVIGAKEDVSCDIKLMDGTEVLTNAAFGHSINLKSIEIPNSVTNVGACCFMECRNLTTVKLPDSIKHLGKCF